MDGESMTGATRSRTIAQATHRFSGTGTVDAPLQHRPIGAFPRVRLFPTHARKSFNRRQRPRTLAWAPVGIGRFRTPRAEQPRTRLPPAGSVRAVGAPTGR